VLFACVLPAWARAISTTQATSPRASAADLALERAGIEEAKVAQAAGDHAAARAIAAEVIAQLLARPDVDHGTAWLELLELAGVTAFSAEDLATAEQALRRVLEVRARDLPDDHEDLQTARQNLGAVLNALGDFAGALSLEEQVFAVRAETLPEDHPDLQAARQNLGSTRYMMGDLEGARELFARVVDVYSRSLPHDDPELQSARLNLAVTLHVLGDLTEACALFEGALTALPEDHPEVQTVRLNLSATLASLGNTLRARQLLEDALAALLRTVPEDHGDIQLVRQNLANTLYLLGDVRGARALYEIVLDALSRKLSDDHPRLQGARENLATALIALGDVPAARTLYEKVLEVRTRTLPSDHPEMLWARANYLQQARMGLAVTIARRVARSDRAPGEALNAAEFASERERCSSLVADVCRAQANSARTAILTSSARESEERCANIMRASRDGAFSLAHGARVFEPLPELVARAFALAEVTRGAGLMSGELARRAKGSTRHGELRNALRAASNAVAVLAQQGTTSEEFDRARFERESVERELVALARGFSDEAGGEVEFDAASLAARLAEREAAVSFWRYASWSATDQSEIGSSGEAGGSTNDSLCAFVVRSAADDAPLRLVDLGPIGPIEEAARAWREGLGVAEDSRGIATSEAAVPASRVHAAGVRLREAILDPIVPLLDGAQRIMVVLDDVLHLVPIDALPLGEDQLVGDRWQIRMRTTLTELVFSSAPLDEHLGLVAFGDVDYEAGADTAPPPHVERAAILRGGAWERGFPALPATGAEVRGIARTFSAGFGADATVELCQSAAASRERLVAVAPKARWLHIATHGWFAPESIKSWSDPEPLDKQSGLALRISGAEQVRGMSPMLLCGLALAGANAAADASGRAPGLITADELSALDLSNCELAVLSACDTNVGERRAGQGVASLQRALQMAGARAVITSLWKVPDEATKELMLDFYRRMWEEKKPKGQALWEAKTTLRHAKDEHGAPKYMTRDWAAWVLTGAPE
jgi:CHAT domain-containing protein/tetratricopeptide (TPR) repeat protein